MMYNIDNGVVIYVCNKRRIVMSMRKSLDKAMTAVENGTGETKRIFKFIKGLSFRGKANAELQLKSNKKLSPLCKCYFNCDKEIKLFPIMLTAGVILFIMSLCCMKEKKDC